MAIRGHKAKQDIYSLEDLKQWQEQSVAAEKREGISYPLSFMFAGFFFLSFLFSEQFLLFFPDLLHYFVVGIL
jgi:hypothetical protein